jgi:hypothetical protein
MNSKNTPFIQDSIHVLVAELFSLKRILEYPSCPQRRRLRTPAALLLWRECNPTSSWHLPHTEIQPAYQRSRRRRDNQACRACRWPRLVHDCSTVSKIRSLFSKCRSNCCQATSTLRSKSPPQSLRVPRRSQDVPSIFCMLPPALMLRYGAWVQMLRLCTTCDRKVSRRWSSTHCMARCRLARDCTERCGASALVLSSRQEI